MHWSTRSIGSFLKDDCLPDVIAVSYSYLYIGINNPVGFLSWIGQHGPFVLFWKMASSHMSLLEPILTCPLGSKTKLVMCWMVLVPSTNQPWTRWRLYPSIHTTWSISSPLEYKTKLVMCWRVLVPSTFHKWTRWQLYSSIHTHGLANTVQCFYCRYPYVITETHSYRSIGFQNKIS